MDALKYVPKNLFSCFNSTQTEVEAVSAVPHYFLSLLFDVAYFLYLYFLFI